MSAAPSGAVATAFTHLLADFGAVARAKLGDQALVGGLVVAAASAAGLAVVGAGGAPMLRTLPHGGVSAVLVCDGSHILVHTFPADGLLLLDVLVRGGRPAADRAADVFARRLGVTPARADGHARGALPSA